MRGIQASKKSEKYHLILFAYWCILLIWQNIRSASNRSGVDIVIKVCLLVLLVGYYLLHHRLICKPGALVIWYSLAVATIITFILDTAAFSLGKLVSYGFPLLFIFITLLIGNDITINLRQLLQFLRLLILTVLYIAIYAVLFCTDQFRTAFSITNAYGNELSSFLSSNMEYGMYLTFGITACAICLKLDRKISRKTRVLYYIAIVIFAINLILTYSRTSILAMLAILLSIMLFYKKSTARWYIFAAIMVGALIICFVPVLRVFIEQIVFKNNTASGRDVMLSEGLEIYRTYPLLHRIFGAGMGATGVFLGDAFGHRSVHNAFLQILLSNGIIGLVALISILLWNIVQNVKLLRQKKSHRFLASIFIGYTVAAVVFLLATTCTLFYSNIDAYVLTVMAIIVPLYVRNAINRGVFEDSGSSETVA